jgi:hypothetical protein
MDTAKISVVVTNSSGTLVKGAQLKSGPQVLIDLGDIPAGRQVERTRRFTYDPGPTSFHAICGDQAYAADTWLVLTGKGPYEYEITILPDYVHVDRWSPPKGQWTEDIRPATLNSSDPAQ